MNTLNAEGCFHCGLPVPKRSEWAVVINQVVRPMCCPGCMAVAQAITSGGLGNYYTDRTAYAASAQPGIDQQNMILGELTLYDEGQSTEQAEEHAGEPVGEPGEATFAITGIRCAACVWLIEQRLRLLPGLHSANMNVATERLHVRWDKTRCKPSLILGAVRAIGYTAHPFDAVLHGEQLLRTEKKLFRQLFIAALLMMQTMMYSVPLYLASEDSMDPITTALMRWAGLVLTIPAVMYCAQPFFKGAWSNIKNRVLGMDVPVVIAIIAAFLGSFAATVRGVGEIYFDSISMFIFLLLCSRYLELKTRRKAACSLENLQRALPPSALLLRDYPAGRAGELVAADTLAAGDVILVKPGQAIATDGVIIEGQTEIDVSLLSGESRPKSATIGDALPGGAVNITQAILLRVSTVARQSTLSVIMRLAERATQAKPQLALWADRVAAWFVALLLLFALGVFCVWQVIDPDRAWQVTIAVLVVSCPCALSLATPTALAAALNNLLRRGVLVVQPHVLETLQRSTHIIFDKTGTLTVGKPTLTNMLMMGDETPVACLQLAEAMEAGNAHPLSASIVAAAAKHAAGMVTPEIPVDDIDYVTGQGLEAHIGDIRYRLGRAEFVAQLTGTRIDTTIDTTIDNRAALGATSVYLGRQGAWLARFDFSDALRPDARQVVAYFQACGKQIMLLSGDRQDTTEHIAAALGIPQNQTRGDCLPEQKLAFVQALQKDGAVVAMVGDGINDAAVLSAADVSFAMGGGAALAQTHADAVLLSGHLSSLAESADIAAKTMTVIYQNLAWATLYNLIAIPAAALGLVSPWVSGVGMTLSSVLVVLNALRLLRAKLKRSKDGSLIFINTAQCGRGVSGDLGVFPHG